MPQTRPNTWHPVSASGYVILQACTLVRGSSPDRLSLGWLPAVRFIPWESISGELPPTVGLRSPFFAGSDAVCPVRSEFSQISLSETGGKATDLFDLQS